MGSPVHPRRVRFGIKESIVEHQRAKFQSLCSENGYQSRSCDRWSHRRPETSLRHLGKHRERSVQDGEHWKSRLHPGKMFEE